jgi:hypothetical protein
MTNENEKHGDAGDAISGAGLFEAATNEQLGATRGSAVFRFGNEIFSLLQSNDRSKSRILTCKDWTVSYRPR